MEQIWEGVLGDGLEGNFWEEGLPLCVQSKFECLHGCSGHNILWQILQVWDYSENGGGCLNRIFKMRANKRYVQREEILGVRAKIPNTITHNLCRSTKRNYQKYASGNNVGALFDGCFQ